MTFFFSLKNKKFTCSFIYGYLIEFLPPFGFCFFVDSLISLSYCNTFWFFYFFLSSSTRAMPPFGPRIRERISNWPRLHSKYATRRLCLFIFTINTNIHANIHYHHYHHQKRNVSTGSLFLLASEMVCSPDIHVCTPAYEDIA